jgi:hypothetical protein
MAPILAFVTSYIRYCYIEGDGDNRMESSKSIKVSFPAMTQIDAASLIDADALDTLTRVCIFLRMRLMRLDLRR